MLYKYDGELFEGTFINRLNRFVAQVEIDGQIVEAHVKNTGRMRELLAPGAKSYLIKAKNPNRKTKYDLVSVKKGNRYVNVDSQVSNEVIERAFKAGYIRDFEDFDLIKREVGYKNSRLDLYVEKGDQALYVEVKSVDFLINSNIGSFPGAPTSRGCKHLRDLEEIVKAGKSAMVIFLIVREEAEFFRPCFEIDRKFSDGFYSVLESGVEARAYSSKIGKNTIELGREVKILSREEALKTIDKELIETTGL